MSNVKIPKYTLGEELVNYISHGVGGLLAIAGLVLTIVFAAKNHNPIGVVSSCIYGTSMILLYVISCLYHALSPRIKAKKVFRILDHCGIYLYIAGCYTPFCLSLIRGAVGWIIFTIIWIISIIGIILNSINLEKYKIISVILYVVMGWMIVFSFNSLINKIDKIGFYLLLSGGIIYTLGVIVYAIGSKKKYFHSIFHFFVLAGSILQFFSILLYAI